MPQSFYAAFDQLPPQFEAGFGEKLRDLSAFGRDASRDGDASYVYSILRGTQFPFEHTTTADKFIYEAELRTGTGAHFRYAQHLRDVLQLMYCRCGTKSFPAREIEYSKAARNRNDIVLI